VEDQILEILDQTEILVMLTPEVVVQPVVMIVQVELEVAEL
jgi:hypothetical protein|tara:strand:- start:29 stop:151 length:123 start_codon:yes stop_codon:yes gene_type:complete